MTVRSIAAVLAVALAACSPPAAGPSGPGAVPVGAVASPAVSSASPSPVATPVLGAAPVSAGAVLDAGVLFVRGADDAIHRYDGATGTLTPVGARSSFDRETTEGVYVVGRHGGAALLRWDGTKLEFTCGGGVAATVASTGACASAGFDGIHVRLPDEEEPRQILPADWGASTLAWSPDGRRLLLIRMIEPRPPGPGMDPGLSALWVIEPDGRLRELYRPPSRGVLSTPAWSPDGTKALVRQIETTSASFAADGIGITTALIDLERGTTRSLGTVMHKWATWSSDGRLALVRGGDRRTWWDKELFVVDVDGRERRVGPNDRVAIAPAWGPRGQLAWVSGPATQDYSGDGYVDGRGAGQRVGMIELGNRHREISCGDGRVVEGIRWSADGEQLLLLCRKPGRDPRPLELWLHRLSDDTSARIVTGLPGDSHAAGFGYYGAHAAITSVAAWSHGLPRP